MTLEEAIDFVKISQVEIFGNPQTQALYAQVTAAMSERLNHMSVMLSGIGLKERLQDQYVTRANI